MLPERIYRKANEYKRRAESSDPRIIARELGLHVYYNDDFKSLKGMYAIVCKRRCVFLNSNLSDSMSRLVLAHEIGHDALHREYAAGGPFREISLFDMSSKPEYEANAFAAHLLIEDEDVLELAKEGGGVVEIASALGVNLDLLLIKMTELNKLGYHFNTPYTPKGAFLVDY